MCTHSFVLTICVLLSLMSHYFLFLCAPDKIHPRTFYWPMVIVYLFIHETDIFYKLIYLFPLSL